MGSSVITSLSLSFKQVPPAAIPAFLDCVLSSTGVSPSTLFESLIEQFPFRLEDTVNGDKRFDSDDCNHIASLVAGLCHLLKNFGFVAADNHNALQLFVWRVFIPLMKMVRAYDLDMLNKIVESFFDVVIETNVLDMLGVSLVPFLLRSVGFSMGMRQHEESDFIKWGDLCLRDSLNTIDMDENYIAQLSGSFPIPLSCHLLNLILNAAFQSHQAAPKVESFAAGMLWDLCNTTERLLSQSVEHRSCAVSFLLPAIFKAFSSQSSLKISHQGNLFILSRNGFIKRIWECCKKLFSVGSIERRDAYSVLSLCLSSGSWTDGTESFVSEKDAVQFDLRSEQEFWDEIKIGLVVDESLVRKQSLHILKSVLSIIEVSETISEKKPEGNSVNRSMTRKETWAEKEAKSLGVGELYGSVDSGLTSQQGWQAFLLLYEMLEEYGTHLVEAAWSNQIDLLIKSSLRYDGTLKSDCNNSHHGHMETPDEEAKIFNWLEVLWNRGFRHDNPLVRCTVMESFFGIEWRRYKTCTQSMSQTFVLGPFIEGLNDPTHHKDFGLKGIYTSRTIEGAAQYVSAYTSCLNPRNRVGFLINLASLAKKQSFCRAGFMALVQCIVSTAYVVGGYGDKEMGHLEDKFSGTAQESSCGHLSQDDMTHILDVLKFVAESSRQHFNHKYRIRVYQKVLETAASVVNPCNVPLGTLLQFVSAIPREFTDHDGLLRKMMLEWLQGCNRKTSNSLCTDGTRLLASLYEYLKGFTSDNVESFDDEDLEAWDSQTKRWARVFFLMINKEEHLTDIIMFVQNNGLSFFQEKNHLKRAPAKFLIFILSMLLELQNMQDGISELSSSVKSKSGIGSDEQTGKQIVVDASSIKKKFAVVLLSILKELIPFADSSCSIFWSHTTVENGALPGSVIGKLGGPSQRRLSVPTTTAVLEAVLSVKTIGLISSYCAQFTSGVGELKLALAFFWKFTQHTISSQICNSEAAAEIYLAAFEALASVLNAFVSLCSAGAFNLLENDSTLLSMVDGEFWLQVSVPAFVRNINHLLTAGVLVRSRRAVLLSWKWLCVESLLSVMHILDARRIPEDRKSFFSDDTVKSIFQDIVESLENAGEGSALPMLKSVRLALGILASGKSSLDGFSGVDTQTMWQLVKSCWILHISCKKRRVAPIAALLSSVLHSSLFSNKDMHITEDEHGPLKWFVEKVLEEGQKSPRTIRLAALHLSGLWLMYPRTIKYYIKELRLLTLYGSVAFDEDFEAELSDNNDARTEVSLLAKSPDPELTELFINTELYARVSVAGLFQKLANLAYMVEPASQNQDCQDALVAGKLFLLELLDAAVHDKDLAKELYKKYSAIHRRKIRAWQMICIMSRFVCNDIVGQVMDSVHICLHRNNLPAVRQYLETFAINIYLKFPALVKEQLVPILKNYDSKAQQALSSYVFVAANVILHAEKIAQQTHLRELLPPILPLLTSHHHSLRGFAQLLVHRVLFRLFPPVESTSSHTISLEKLSFENLKSYLDKNPDCSRLRASMEGFLDAYDPSTSATPAGVFVNRVEESEFECVPTCLMDNVLSFLNDVREDLRASMAKDVVTIKNEGFKIDEEPKRRLIMSTTDEERLSEPSSLDFQRKITLSKHEKQDASSTSVLRNGETYKRLFEMEKEDELVTQLLRSRSMEVERLKSGRQSLILVASLVDRIPNLAGLARTCEVFKASSLAVADASIIHDKQFQLISVTAEKWVPIMEVPVNSLKLFLEKKKREGFSILGLEQTANSVSLDKYQFPKKTVLVLGREKEGIPVDIIHILDACIEIPQLGVVRSLNVHVSGAIALWEYTRQQRI
ncbi:tRNA/rRNA methyltransferase (SpoU) family protein [Arabidopsis thaliana]|uniref:tRNA (guanosine(18)-2'-O)-methyltransferase TARBP1 n=1 Tax=Arabidopsis thaliana TaxID=3702 RepID=A0A1P8B7Z4_ARATH|nr:tRNA/rRNA methyltransferase (SpoU) family protein [Arabidopsis thaliana]ANM67716.1 tRNA/rRNA methyltransferase (SpoU) family protein [Arabidopsis thaliana]|eukprot:NP_001329531.1 tRNA/rRNA methyltransferase (SpoU) family protein [Arabidopsis thaliana]